MTAGPTPRRTPRGASVRAPVARVLRGFARRVAPPPPPRPAPPPKRPPFDDYRFAQECATNPVFTSADAGLVARLDAEAPAPGTRHFVLPSIDLTLRAAEIEAIRRHGIVRLAPAKIWTRTPPPADVAFATVTNDKYAPGLEALILSLLRIYPGLASDFVVFHDDSLSAFSIARLARIYPRFRFEARSTARYDLGQIGDSVNHRRVGLLGYLSIEALGLEGYSRVIVLDVDTIVVNDISRLWTGDAIYAVPDHGLVPFGLVSEHTGLPVINSGMLSFPRRELGPQAMERAWSVLPQIEHPIDPLLDNFADQKFWNVYLAQRGVEFVPVNYNTNRSLIDKHFPDLLADVALLHMTGPKPWYDFSDQDLVSDDDRTRLQGAKAGSRSTFAIWNQLYLSGITATRIAAFRAECGPGLAELAATVTDRPAVVIGNGPSLKVTDLSVFSGFETFVFNWFVHHDDFDTVAPDHLVLGSHMFFGGWHTTRPAIPPEFLAALATRQHRPRIWTSYYFKDLIDATPELAGYDVSYFLYEKPFKAPISRHGSYGLDLLGPLTDANTGVLAAGIPIALHLGVQTVVLVGCDSNYASASGSYFYAAGQHSSRTTRESQLVNTWADGGTGQFSYQRMVAELAQRGVKLLDATVGGSLTVVPKLPLDQVRATLLTGHPQSAHPQAGAASPA
jgi:lipopolysaccharide biosynthesis glycosyltransferase